METVGLQDWTKENRNGLSTDKEKKGQQEGDVGHKDANDRQV